MKELIEYIENRIKVLQKEASFHIEEMDKDLEYIKYHEKEYLICYWRIHELEDLLLKIYESKGE